MYHPQSCCECVDIEDIIGDPEDLIGSPLFMCEDVSDTRDNEDSGDWTFYKFATQKGYVTIRWFGLDSYYSTTVCFEKFK